MAIIFLQDIITSETIVIRRPSTLSQFVGITITDICWIYCFLTYSKLEPAVYKTKHQSLCKCNI